MVMVCKCCFLVSSKIDFRVVLQDGSLLIQPRKNLNRKSDNRQPHSKRKKFICRNTNAFVNKLLSSLKIKGSDIGTPMWLFAPLFLAIFASS